MKIKFLSSVFVLAAFAAVGNAQSVVVTSKKVTYNRPRAAADYKKSFTITYPKIKAATPTLSKKIENAFSYQRILGVNLDGELNDIQWLERADYKVKYNKNGSLCIELSIEGSGAYPSSSSKVIVVDTRTGLRARPIDVFANRTGLIGVLRKMQEKEKQETLALIKKGEPDADEPGLLFGDRHFNSFDLEGYELSNTGVTFHYDYAFPHVALMYKPSGEFYFTWAKLKPYIKPGGLLSRMKG